ncbi:Alt-like RNA polymerase ADP-ribosyltransferase [Aeromonas phage phiAS4]|uniref:Uncharacterized protein n=1 Tax=Aeromonas phage phiAS4 TaxID=879628 RepID=E1A1C5_9CAUD|nr:Alt-like RNA polymerase ADP-ribosyltransferase [Aeromonas phage phiAS4]ADM79649.1 hypothetical protein phiAS4_ORF0077 [Aeromonas phage phiAS4]
MLNPSTVVPVAIEKPIFFKSHPSFGGYTADTINSPITFEELEWACKNVEYAHDVSSHRNMPWMNLELGSYEQVRLIFDFHGKNSPDIIRMCNRIAEQRYTDSCMCILKKYDDYVSSYCDEEFSNVSAALRSGIFDDANKKFVTECIRRMDSHMAESENFNKSVWRGMSLNKADYMKFKDSGSILFKNFVSTSFCPLFFNYGIAQCRHLDFNEITREIVIDGDPHRPVTINMHIDCHNVKHLIPGNLSPYPEECEVILDKNTVLVIDEIFEYVSHVDSFCFVKAKAVPLSQFTGTTLVV